jgi:hypothetical protein
LHKIILVLFLLFTTSLNAMDLSMDSLRSKVLTSAVALYFQSRGYGDVENITVDTNKKTLNFMLMPEGETQKLSINIGSYKTQVVDKEEFLVLQNVQTNRTWLNRIFADHMPDGIKIPLGSGTKSVGSLLLKL